MPVDPDLADCYPNTVGHRVFTQSGRANEGAPAAPVPLVCKIVHEDKRIESDDEVVRVSKTGIYFPQFVDVDSRDTFVLPAPFTPSESATMAVEHQTDFTPGDPHHTVVRI